MLGKFQTIHVVAGFIVLATLILAGCQPQAPTITPAVTASPTVAIGTAVLLPYGKYTDISVAELSLIMKNKNFILINVNVPDEGDIPGTDISLPYNQMDKNLDKLPGGKPQKMVLYDKGGRDSALASAAMVKLGYTAIYNLVGGTDAWQAEGNNIVKPTR